VVLRLRLRLTGFRRYMYVRKYGEIDLAKKSEPVDKSTYQTGPSRIENLSMSFYVSKSGIYQDNTVNYLDQFLQSSGTCRFS